MPHLRLFSLLVPFVLLTSSLCTSQQEDKIVCNRVFSFAFEHKLIEKPIGDILVSVGQLFLGKPYEANTLDRSDGEQLVVNLHTFDCVTFIENALALARCTKSGHLSFESYKSELQNIRYRGGAIEGYASRLHYFSEWIRDNEKKGIIHDRTRELGGTLLRKQIDFMSTHRDSYAGLKNDSDVARIKRTELELSAAPISFIPKSKLESVISKIQSGDIIAITTKKNGLDISHAGIAVHIEDGSLHLLHAPDAGDSIRITSETLLTHLRQHSTETGIVVLRAVGPGE